MCAPRVWVSVLECRSVCRDDSGSPLYLSSVGWREGGTIDVSGRDVVSFSYAFYGRGEARTYIVEKSWPERRTESRACRCPFYSTDKIGEELKLRSDRERVFVDG